MPESLPADAPRARVGWGAVMLWGARVAWIAVAVIGGDAVGEALADRARAVQLVGTTAAWIGWAAGALAFAIPSVVALTAVRAIVPAAVVVAAVTALTGASGGAVLALAVPAVVAAVLVASAETGRRFVEAGAYGDERRFPLRPPYGYLAATVVTWALWVAAVLAAPLALAAGNVIVGGLAAVVGAVATWLFPRRWHQLSRRWLVTVPAGLVVHDPVVLSDTLMLPRRIVASVRAETGSREGALDLTGPTPGLALRITLAEPMTAALAPRRAVHLTALLVAPSRPGAALREIDRRA